MRNLRIIQSWGYNGAMNMAEDEALFQAAIEHNSDDIILRLYDWSPACMSIGYFQSLTRRVDEARCASFGYDIVRRPTGGRAVLHDNELTYCVVAKADGLGDTTLDSYLEISKALNRGLNILGVKSEIEPAKKAKHIGSPACFDSLSSFEIAVNGKKIVGSAQYRTKGYLLQHGSILLDIDPKILFDCLLPKASGDEITAFSDFTTSINNEMQRIVTAQETAEAMISGFKETFVIPFKETALTDTEKQWRDKLYSEKYTSKEWNYLK